MARRSTFEVIFVPATILDGFCRKLLGGGARLGIVVILGIAMLFNTGKIVMRIFSKRQPKELVLYSPQLVARL